MKILVVDDEKIVLDGLVKTVKEVVPNASIYGFNKSTEALEFVKDNKIDIAFLDIEMGALNGIEFAKEIKMIYPTINIIFVTGYSEYAIEAFRLKASGYLLKPFTKEDIQKEIEDLRNGLDCVSCKKIRISTFGNFEIYVDNKALTFKYAKTKELIAYLVDRNGAFCKNGEIMSILWEGEQRTSYLSNLKKDLMDTLKKEKIESLIETSWGKMRINKEVIDCDYYRWLEGDATIINLYRGEYMSQYSWAEFTNADIYNKEF